MKVLLPFLIQNNISIYDDRIFGGIEKFLKSIYRGVSDVIPVEITKEERTKRQARGILNLAIVSEAPDVIMCNHHGKIYSSDLSKYDVPVVWLCHESRDRSMMYIEMIKNMFEFVDNGGHLYFVSPLQLEHYQEMSKRLHNREITGVKGFINSAACSGSETVYEGERVYDAVTIGRAVRGKDPFYIHKKLSNTGLTTCVLTGSKRDYKSANEVKYVDSNMNWDKPQYTYRDLPHDQVMEEMSKGGVYISTCTFESWGITALEALSRGLPVILMTDSTGRHSSEIIADLPSDIRLLPKSVDSETLARTVRELNEEFTYEKRLDLSKRTKEKHLHDKWIEHIRQILSNAANEKSPK